MQRLNHPMKVIVKYVREMILGIDNQIGEGVYWNAPTFFFTGKMKPFEPKEYKRHIAGFVFNRQDCIRMVFLQNHIYVLFTKSILEVHQYEMQIKLSYYDLYETLNPSDFSLRSK